MLQCTRSEQAGFGLFCGYAAVLLLGLQLWLGVGDIMQTHSNHQREYANIRFIENAKKAWAATNNKNPNDTPSGDELAPFMPDGQFPPRSVEGETYQINRLSVSATCVRPPPQF